MSTNAGIQVLNDARINVEWSILTEDKQINIELLLNNKVRIVDFNNRNNNILFKISDLDDIIKIFNQIKVLGSDKCVVVCIDKDGSEIK